MSPALSGLVDGFDADAPFAVPGSWTQGRTAYGGMTAALSVQAALNTLSAELPPLRTAQFAFVAPVIDTVEFTADEMRRGRSATSVAVTARSRDQVAAHATLVFASPRPSGVVHDTLVPPAVADPTQCPPFAGDSSTTPAFVDNFDMRRAGGGTLLAGDEPRLLAWVRHRDASGVHPAVALIALADSLPPAAMTSFVEWAPVSTMTWTVHLCTDVLPQPDEWLLLDSTATHTGDGYSHQSMTMWNAAGQPIVTGSQTVAVFA